MFRKMIRMQASDFAFISVATGGVFLLTHLICVICALAFDQETFLAMGGIMALITAGILCVVFCGINVCMSFELCLSYSITRRRALIHVLGVVALEILAGVGLAFLLSRLELWVFHAPLRAYNPRIDLVAAQIPAFVYPIVASAVFLAGLVFGALVQRFGRKGLWSIYIVAIGSSFLMQISDKIHPQVPPLWLAVGLVGTALAAWSLWSLLHAKINCTGA